MSYGVLACVVVAVATAVAVVCAVRVRPPWRWWLAVALVMLVLLALTAVFDSVMIAADLYRYEQTALSGIRIGAAPVEDFAWPVAAALLLPALWELLRARAPAAADPARDTTR